MKILNKVRWYLIWVLLPKSEIKTPMANAMKSYNSFIHVHGKDNNESAIYSAVSSVMAYRFPNPEDIFLEALEYSKRKDTLFPKINDFETFSDSANWMYWWMKKRNDNG